MSATVVTAPANAPRQTVFISTDLIDVRDRLREIDWGWAEALRVSFERDGMSNPIEVNRVGDRYRLVAGGHRWAAHQLMDQPVECFVVDKDWAATRSTQIAENVFRNNLTPLERAAFIAEMYEVERLRAGLQPGEDGRKLSAGKRWAKDASDTLSLASGLADAVATQVGLDKRTIYRDLALHAGLNPGLADTLRRCARGTPAAQLKTLSKLPPEQQATVSSRVANGVSIEEAMAAVLPAPAPVSAEDKRLSAFLGTFSRMGRAEAKGAVDALVRQAPWIAAYVATAGSTR